MLAHRTFEQAHTLDQFLAEYGVGNDAARWAAAQQSVALSAEHEAVVKTFTRELHVFVLAGAWCGDCASQCPIFERFAELAPCLKVRYFDRDADPAVATELAINGGHRVPAVVFFSEDGHEISRYGERTLTQYRKAGQSAAPTPWGVGEGTVAGDWLREFERAHWIARLSPRLRKLHGD